jgi:flagellar biogenesis protein FliO
VEFESAGRLLGACVVIGIVLYGLRTVARALGRTSALAGPRGRIVAVLETTVLPNATSLHVVRVAERFYLIGRGAASLATLCEISPESICEAPAVLERTAPRGSLERWLACLRGSPAARG